MGRKNKNTHYAIYYGTNGECVCAGPWGRPGGAKEQTEGVSAPNPKCKGATSEAAARALLANWQEQQAAAPAPRAGAAQAERVGEGDCSRPSKRARKNYTHYAIYHGTAGPCVCAGPWDKADGAKEQTEGVSAPAPKCRGAGSEAAAHALLDDWQNEQLVAKQLKQQRRRRQQPTPAEQAAAAADPCSGVDLSNEQQRAVGLVQAGQNVFLTGVAGTGKSHVIRAIKGALRAKHGAAFRERVAAVGPTGMSALGVGGSTLHSFAGCGRPRTVADFGKCWGRRDQWKGVQVLIVDEISMVQAEFLDLLDQTVREIRGDVSNAFGGIQLVFCGDFFQLPPVSGGQDMAETKVPEHYSHAHGDARRKKVHIPVCTFDQFDAYAFQSRCWDDARFEVVELGRVFRQSDKEFIANLASIRQGNIKGVNRHVADYFGCLGRALPENADGIEPTRLNSLTVDVREKNDRRLREIEQPSRVFEARDSCVPLSDAVLDRDDHAAEAVKLMQDKFFTDADEKVPVLRVVELKVGAQVMLVKNLYEDAHGGGQRLVNGSRGIVVAFETDAASKLSHPVVKFRNGRKVTIMPEQFEKEVYDVGTCVREQIPLVLAWVLTIHKSQGLSLDAVVVDIKGCFAEGQAYVALSRARSREGLQVVNFDPSRVTASEDVKDFYERARCRSQGGGVGATAPPAQAKKWWEATLGNPQFAAWRDRLLADGKTVFARVVNSRP